jgi:murein L,D-transpeptidase YafK
MAVTGIAAGPALAAAPPLRKADLILVLKSQRKLELVRAGRVIKVFPIALGSEPRGPKHRRGDGRTPEGSYVIDGRNDHSAYHLALHVSYPGPADLARAAGLGIDPGGAIFIHGLPRWYQVADPDHFYKDWTDGCIAVGNRAIEQIWAATQIGTPVVIKP